MTARVVISIFRIHQKQEVLGISHLHDGSVVKLEAGQ